MARQRRGGHGGGHSSSERWLLTYADLITLLLAFFIILYAMSQSDYHKMNDLQRSLSSAFHATSGGSKEILAPGDPSVNKGQTSVLPESSAMLDMQEQIEHKIMAENGPAAASDVSTHMEQRGLVISLASSSFFESGDDHLRPQTIGELRSVASVLKAAGRDIIVEGHTDNTPIHTARFPSNWELSTGRSTAVVKWLIASYHLTPARLSAAGYGEYHPLESNASPENRSKNRRVDIVLLRSDLRGQRPGGQL